MKPRKASQRPELYVLAGVNGAGKSSIGGYHLRQHGGDWFNPDTEARHLMAHAAMGQTEANAAAWQAGRDLLLDALAHGRQYAFETTLGGTTIPRLLLQATRTHAVRVWFCGLASPELHLERVRARVAAGGHDIPEAKIRERCVSSVENLIALMPHLAELCVYDNSTPADADGVIPDPLPVLHMKDGVVAWPSAVADLRATPRWATPIVQAALGDPDPPARPTPVRKKSEQRAGR